MRGSQAHFYLFELGLNENIFRLKRNLKEKETDSSSVFLLEEWIVRILGNRIPRVLVVAETSLAFDSRPKAALSSSSWIELMRAAWAAHPRARIVVGSPRPPPTTVPRANGVSRADVLAETNLDAKTIIQARQATRSTDVHDFVDI